MADTSLAEKKIGLLVWKLSNHWQSKLRKILKDYKRYGKPKGYITPPRFKASEIDSERFKEIAIKTNSPVIIEGFAKNWDCTKKWSPKYLKDNYKDEVVPVRRESDRLDPDGYIYVN